MSKFKIGDKVRFNNKLYPPMHNQVCVVKEVINLYQIDYIIIPIQASLAKFIGKYGWRANQNDLTLEFS